MQVELLEQLLLDAGAHAVAEQRAVWYDHGSTACLRHASQLSHDELEEEQRGLACLLVLEEVAQDASLFLTAERRIGQDHIYPFARSDLGDLHGQRVGIGDAGVLQAVEQQVHLRQ